VCTDPWGWARYDLPHAPSTSTASQNPHRPLLFLAPTKQSTSQPVFLAPSRASFCVHSVPPTSLCAFAVTTITTYIWDRVRKAPSLTDKMRLLNLNSLDLVEFIDFEKPPYVILSHTWGAEEVSLQELQSQHPDVKRKNGWTKIMNFARKGIENGFEWGWVDTCCIDKTSSAELSEAINSMFKVSHTSIPICSSLYENYRAASCHIHHTLALE
jgi:Heterokaryon incompatibility protein (HET)